MPVKILDQFTTSDILTHFAYDPDKGELIWRIDYRKFKAGTPVARRTVGGMQVLFKKKTMMAHRIIWFLVNGEFPKEFIDHIDGDAFNNKISNLRLASHGENSFNRKVHRNNSTGFKGVHKWKDCATYGAFIRVNKELKYLGSFKTAELAYEAYCAAAQRYHGEFARVA